jgi:Ran GTPase-activating protein (RanGAP) involved in mRNA processing and transport
LKCNTNLKSLGANSIGDKGVRELLNMDLTHLDLAYNKITAEGVELIANLLKVNTKLLSLNLGTTLLYLELNEIADQGVVSIGTALQNNKALEVLNLCNTLYSISLQSFFYRRRNHYRDDVAERRYNESVRH